MKTKTKKKIAEIDWDFKKENTQYFTHGIHKYPARMVPHIARHLISLFSKKGDTVVDPFVGSGTVAVESILAGRKVFGNDLNPLAILLSNVRARPIAAKKLSLAIDTLKKVLESKKGLVDKETTRHVERMTEDANLLYWFSDESLKKIVRIQSAIQQLDANKDIKDFLLVCFSTTVRQASYLRQGEYKIYRIPKNKVASHKPDVYKLFFDTASRYSELMNEYVEHLDDNFITPKYTITAGDARALDQKTYADSFADLVVTSPPYGDSRTTVAYGQFSRYSLILMGFDKKETYDIDKNLLGGQPQDFLSEIKSPTLHKIISEIEARDPARAKDTLWFMVDLYLTIKEMARVLKKGGHACIVIGNRAVRRIRVPTSTIIAEMAVGAPNGYRFDHLITFGRNIPSKNNPIMSKFKVGQGVEWIKTMSTEDIIILKKS